MAGEKPVGGFGVCLNPDNTRATRSNNKRTTPPPTDGLINTLYTMLVGGVFVCVGG